MSSLNKLQHWQQRARDLNAWLNTHDFNHPDYNQNLKDFHHAKRQLNPSKQLNQV